MATHRLIGFLKAVLPLVVIVLIAIPAWNYWGRRVDAPVRENQVQVLPQDLAVRTEGLTFSQTEGGKTLFTVTAKLDLGFKDNRKILNSVEVIVFPQHEGEPTRRIRSDECAYDEQSQHIRFIGNVNMDLDERTHGRTEELIYSHRDRLIASPVRTLIEQPGSMTGESDQLDYFMDQGLLRLTGNVDIQVIDGAGLRGGLVAFQQNENWATVSQGIYVESPNGWVRGNSGRAELEPATYRPKKIVIEGEVSGESHAAGSPDTWKLSSNWLQATISAAGNVEHFLARENVRVEKAADTSQVVTGGEVEAMFDTRGQVSLLHARQSAVLQAPDTVLRSSAIQIDAQGAVSTEDASVLELRGSVIEGRRFTITRAGVVTFSTPVRATMRMGERRTSADRTEARFDGTTNQLLELVQTGNFEFNEGARHGRAQRAVVRDGGSTIVLEGLITSERSSTRLAVVEDPQMNVEGQEIRLNQKDNSFEALRDVTTVSRSQAEPLLVTASRAEGSPEEIVYTGNVELWRGSAHIQAGLIRASTRNRTFYAEGNVRSQMDTMRISSQTLDFDESRGTAHYIGTVLARKRDQKGETVLEAADMTVRFNQGQVVDGLASGGVAFTQGARRGKGEQAIYNSVDDEITLIGANAEVMDPQRGLIRGTRLNVKSGGDIIVVQGDPGGRVTSTHKVTK